VTTALALLAAAGMLLVASPWLWPRSEQRVERQHPFVDRLRDRLIQAGLERVGLGTVAVVSGVLALAAGTLVHLLLGVVAITAACAIAALLLPSVVIGVRARRRRRASRVIWPDVVDQLVSAVRSGLALPDALLTLAESGPSQTRAAFVRFRADYRATGNFSLSLDSLKERLADPVADRILETLRMSREVGGSELTTVLRNLGSYLRQESAIRSEVEARQSWIVNAARLGAAAPWVVLLLLASRPEAAVAYNSPQGIALITGGFVVSMVAYRLMIAIGRLPEERRWFS